MKKQKDNHIIKQKTEVLKDKQKEILILIYRYRFLNREQIQTLLQHKHHNRIIIWLNELIDKKYLISYYTKSMYSTPALYSLGSQGRKYFRMYAKQYKIHVSLLDRVWHEKHTSFEFKNRLQFLGDVYLSLISLTRKTDATLTFYTPVDLHGMHNLPKPLPDGFFSITEKTGATKRFFLVILKPFLQNEEMAKQVLLYFSYYQKGIWQQNNLHSFPEIIVICPDLKTKRFLTGVIKNNLKKEPNLSFLLVTQKTIRKQGINKNVLEKVTI